MAVLRCTGETIPTPLRTMMACLFILKEKLFHASETPLLSVRDVRQLIVARLWGTEDEVQRRLQQMVRRHQQRKKDIERYYQEHDHL